MTPLMSYTPILQGFHIQQYSSGFASDSESSSTAAESYHEQDSEKLVESERTAPGMELEDEDLDVYLGDDGEGEEDQCCGGEGRRGILLGQYGRKRDDTHLGARSGKWEWWKREWLKWWPLGLEMKMGRGTRRKERRRRGKREKERLLQRVCGGMVGVVFTGMVLLSLAQIVYLFLGLSKVVWAGDVQNHVNSFEEGAGNLGWYPTGFTRDVVPKPIHSHNDYWRKVPLYEAISVGCISVEADVWYFEGDEELYVGHDRSSLTKNRTLNSLYINPLLDILARQNPRTEFTKGETLNGIFDTDPTQTLYLYIDLKTDPLPTYSSIMKHLIPLHPYLTHYNYTGTINTTSPTSFPESSQPETSHHGPLTIVLTGNAPFEAISSRINNNPRYAFYDAPLTSLSPSSSSPTYNIYNTTNSLTSTTQFSTTIGRIFGTGMTDQQKAKAKRLVKQAHELGIAVRFWDTPGWPVRRRNTIWRELVVEVGVDLLNADDLRGAAESGGW